ncbi:MAG TPA: hypothetical protein VLH10_28295 [Yinghuangia sp.]|nr:hypothetical protein [Yinghuangia sp.]
MSSTRLASAPGFQTAFQVTQLNQEWAAKSDVRRVAERGLRRTRREHGGEEPRREHPARSPVPDPLMLLRFGNETLDCRVIIAIGTPDTGSTPPLTYPA